MKTLRRILAAIALVLAIWAVTMVDYSNLSWQSNHSNYIVIIMGVTAAFNLLLMDMYKAKKKNS